MKKWMYWVAACCACSGLQAASPGEFYTPEEDKKGLEQNGAVDPALPKVLIIGDSISIGYTPPVAKLLAGQANVRRVKVNCGDTKKGVAELDAWLGKDAWDVIHFNFGLHDLCYRHPDAKVQGNRDKVKGTISVPLEDYARNLETIVQRLEKTGAVLIWATTTSVPEGEAGRFVGDEVKYNAAAAKIMEKHGIRINDLHALTTSFKPEMARTGGDVHYTKTGYEKLAAQVAQAMREALASKKPGLVPPQ